MLKKIYKSLLWIQGLYSLVTAVWPIVHIRSFIAVTGPKTDIWLVETVAVLILAIAVLLLVHLRYLLPILPVALMAITMSVGLLVIDFYYPSVYRISKIYMVDGILQMIFLVTWLLLLLKRNVLEQQLR
jgi:hypothetical protein